MLPLGSNYGLVSEPVLRSRTRMIRYHGWMPVTPHRKRSPPQLPPGDAVAPRNSARALLAKAVRDLVREDAAVSNNEGSGDATPGRARRRTTSGFLARGLLHTRDVRRGVFTEVAGTGKGTTVTSWWVSMWDIHHPNFVFRFYS